MAVTSRHVVCSVGIAAAPSLLSRVSRELYLGIHGSRLPPAVTPRPCGRTSWAASFSVDLTLWGREIVTLGFGNWCLFPRTKDTRTKDDLITSQPKNPLSRPRRLLLELKFCLFYLSICSGYPVFCRPYFCLPGRQG